MNTSHRYRNIAEEVAAEIRRRAVSGIRDILLYGSVARDIDLLVIYDDEDCRCQDVPEGVAADLMDKYNTLIAILDCTPSEYQRLMRFPFGWRVMEEGVRL